MLNAYRATKALEHYTLYCTSLTENEEEKRERKLAALLDLVFEDTLSGFQTVGSCWCSDMKSFYGHVFPKKIWQFFFTRNVIDQDCFPVHHSIELLVIAYLFC